MTGSLQIKGGKYYAVLNIKENGKRKQKWIDSQLTVKGNKTRAEKFLREQLRLYEQKEGLMQADMLFSEYARHWLSVQQRKIDIITYQGYEKLLQIHIVPYFEARKIALSDVTGRVFQEYCDEKVTKGRKDGSGGLAVTSVRKHRAILHQICKLAVKECHLINNPCDIVELPPAKRHEPNFYTKEQAEALLVAAKGTVLYTALLIAIFYGLRRSELCGLKWDSINFETEMMTIRHTVVKAQTLVEKDRTKTESSYRTYPLNEKVKELLLGIKTSQERNRKLLGDGYHGSDYVLTWEDGRTISPDYISHAFRKLLKKHRLPLIRFHDLRHSCASILLSDGATLKDVQEWLGHADIQMTANVYGHLDMSRKHALAQSMTGLLPSAS